TKIEIGALIAAICGMVLTFIAAGLSDGGEVGNGVIFGLLLCALFAFIAFFIAAYILEPEEAEEVVMPEEEVFTPLPTFRENFTFTNDLYDSVKREVQKDE
ncbi:MAG: hypothetical protein ACI4RU_00885, partial [Acutalibacteraceae bacterium]